jgi:hypothetical protein
MFRWWVVGATAVVAASVVLFLVSRGKWSDAIVDSGREWIVPDALARGEVLYRDVVYWFGPFTPYFHAAFFLAFGSSFSTLVIAGLVGSLGVLVALCFALRSVTGKSEALLWTALAVPVLVFMPNAGGPILGMGYRIWHAAAFSLLAIPLASRAAGPDRSRRPAFSVGVLCALSGLCRTEWGLATLAAAFLGMWLTRSSFRIFLRRSIVALTAFLFIFGGTVAVFCLISGWRAVVEDCHVLLTGLPPETREFLVAFSGVRDWKAGLAEMAYSTAMWFGVFFLALLWAVGKGDVKRFSRLASRAGALVVVLALAAFLGGAGGAVLFSAAPAFCIAAFVGGLRRKGDPTAGALAAFGFLGFLLSYRRPFHITDSAYVGPPLLLAFVSVAGLVTFAASREEVGVASRLRQGLVVILTGLTVLALVGRTYGYASDPRVPIPGTNGMLSARPEMIVRLESVARAVRREGPRGESLAVFPEGEILNFLCARPNPVRYKLYIPGYLTAANESDVLEELEHSPPSEILILNRSTSEYGPGDFGVAYGRKIGSWMQTAYDVRPIKPVANAARVERWAVLAVRKSANLQDRETGRKPGARPPNRVVGGQPQH